ncbi:MAG: alpha-hydroxy acid oxidase [Pseudomonadales bacterium]
MSTTEQQKFPRKLGRCHNIEDLRRLAYKALPFPIKDHLEGGSDDEVTLADNRRAFDQYSLISRYCTGVEEVDASVTVLGQKIDWPFFAGPSGGGKFFHPDGEIGVGRAAHKYGTAFALSSWSTTSMEDLASQTGDGPRFFQLQPARSREVVADLIQTAKNTGFHAVILTVDNPIHGNRERDARSGFGVPPAFGLKSWLAIACKPHWALSMLPKPPGFAIYDKYLAQPGHDMNWLANQLITNISWDDVAWIRQQWDGPFAIKGLVSVDDCKAAVDAGVSAVILSNQGARHFDTAPATLTMLPKIVEAVGDKVEVIFDSGIRRGTDILKAMALGATACTGARPYCYGLAAGGQAGAERALHLLRTEVERDMIFMGARTIGDITADSIIERHL